MRNNGGLFVYQQIAKTKAEWLAENPIVPERVIVFETDTRMMRMGDGKTAYANLPYRLSQGLSPRVNPDTENWEIYNVETEVWDDTTLRAYPGSAPRLDEETNLWEVWDDEKRMYVKTAFQCGSAYDLLVKYGDYKGTMADFCRQLDNFTRYGEQQVGQLTNAGAGYNSFTFPQEFSEEVYATLTPVNCNCYAVVRNITKQGFHYCLYTHDGNTTANNELANWNACTVSELNLARAMAKAVGLNPFDYDNLTQLFAAHAAEVVANEAAMRMVNNSSMASGRYLCHLAGLNPDSYVNVFSIAKDIEAMNAVCQNEECMAFINTYPAAKDSIKLADIGTTKYAATLAGIVPTKYDYMADLCENEDDMAAVAASATAMAAVIASATAMAAVIASATAMAAVIASANAMAAVAASATAMAAVGSSPVALNRILKTDNARNTLCLSIYLQINYDKIVTATANAEFFIRKTDVIDSGNYRATSTGTKESSSVPNQSLYLSFKIGAWSDGTSVTGTVSHMQNGATVMSKSTSRGGGQNSNGGDGGIEAKAVCVGGCNFTELNDAYTRGYFVYAI